MVKNIYPWRSDALPSVSPCSSWCSRGHLEVVWWGVLSSPAGRHLHGDSTETSPEPRTTPENKIKIMWKNIFIPPLWISLLLQDQDSKNSKYRLTHRFSNPSPYLQWPAQEQVVDPHLGGVMSQAVWGCWCQQQWLWTCPAGSRTSDACVREMERGYNIYFSNLTEICPVQMHNFHPCRLWRSK